MRLLAGLAVVVAVAATLALPAASAARATTCATEQESACGDGSELAVVCASEPPPGRGLAPREGTPAARAGGYCVGVVYIRVCDPEDIDPDLAWVTERRVPELSLVA